MFDIWVSKWFSSKIMEVVRRRLQVFLWHLNFVDTLTIVQMFVNLISQYGAIFVKQVAGNFCDMKTKQILLS